MKNNKKQINNYIYCIVLYYCIILFSCGVGSCTFIDDLLTLQRFFFNFFPWTLTSDTLRIRSNTFLPQRAQVHNNTQLKAHPLSNIATYSNKNKIVQLSNDTYPVNLYIPRSQIFYLVYPESDTNLNNEDSRQWLKLNANYYFNNENNSVESFKNNLTKEDNQSIKPHRAAFSSCVSFIFINSNQILPIESTSRFPASCSESFHRAWYDNNTLFSGIHPLPHVVNTMVCGGIWVPRGGTIGDIDEDIKLKLINQYHSIVFLLPTLLLTLLKNKLPMDKFHHPISQISQTFINSSNDIGQLRVCFYPSRTPLPDIYPRDIGHITWIQRPILVPFESFIDIKTPVRLFINPGWQLQVTLQGTQFTSSSNILSLKLHSCEGFSDSLSIRQTYSISPTTHSHSIFPNDAFRNTTLYSLPPQTATNATFIFDSDFKLEESDLPQWQAKYLEQISPISFHNKQVVNQLQSIWNQTHYTTLNNQHPMEHILLKDTEPMLFRQLFEQKTIEKLNDDYLLPDRTTLNQRHPDTLVEFKICFYATQQQLKGTLIGTTYFYSDHEDSIELVGLIIIIIVIVPTLCGTTLSCYCFRHRKLRQKLRRLRLVQQRDEIERRLLNHLGVTESIHEERQPC